MTRNFKTVLVVIAGVSMTGTTALAGGVEREPTKVKFALDSRSEGGYFEGSVSSDNPTCQKGRKVVVKYLDGNDRIGSDKTDGSGFFEVRVSGFAASGTYKAIAKRKETAGVICKKGVDTSEEIHDG